MDGWAVMTRNINILTGMIIIIFCAVLWFVVIPNQIQLPEDSVYPKLLIGLISINALILILQNIKNHKAKDGKTDELSLIAVFRMNFLYLIVLIAIAKFGFYVPALCFLVLAMISMGERNWKKIVITAPVVISIIYLMMEIILKFPLP